MKEKQSEINLIRKNFSLKNINEKSYFTSYSNITGEYIPKINHYARHKNISLQILFQKLKIILKTAINFYRILKREEKINYK